jgi:protein-glutamine gamma-glutamyltransferase
MPDSASAGPVPSPATSGLATAPRSSALERHFQLSLFLLLLTSVLTLISTGKLDPFSMLLPPLALLAKGYRWWRGCKPEISPRAANWLVLAYFVFFPADLLWISRILAADAQNPLLFAALLSAIHLMLFAMIVRLYSASTTRDYLFLAMLASSAMLASAILTVDTTFLVFFFTFMLLAVSTFVGLEMRRGAEGATSPAIDSGTPQARRLHAALGVTSGVIALGALVAGAAIFFLLPRFNAGYFSRFDLQPSMISGFTDNVELGQTGEIKRSNTVVMRIQVEGGPEAGENIHWRGIALTTFDGRRWFTESHNPVVTSEGPDGWTHLPENGRRDNLALPDTSYLIHVPVIRDVSILQNNTGLPDNALPRENSVPPASPTAPRQYTVPLHYTILLEPIASDALFVAAEPVRIRGQFASDSPAGARLARRSYLVMDKTGSLSNPFHNFASIRYDAVSEVPRVPAQILRAAPAEYDPATRNLYLQLPHLDARIPTLARQIAGNARNPYDQAQAVERYLRAHYAYTLDLTGPPPADPLAYFLFDRRAGHCEYFAAAMTVMMRSLGVPARYVNGFLPGEYNSVGGDFIVRARDAHSWVEIFFPGYGWITFDPTPGSDAAPEGILTQAALYWDWFEMQWTEWVINYDFFHQYTLAQNLQRASRNWSTDINRSFDRARNKGIGWTRQWQRRLTALPIWLLIPMLLLGALIAGLRNTSLRERLLLAWRMRGMATHSSLPPQAASLSYRRMLQLLEQRGWQKLPEQTPLEFAASLPSGELRAPVLDLTDIYLAARFGSQTTDGKRFAALLATLQTALRTESHAH